MFYLLELNCSVCFMKIIYFIMCIGYNVFRNQFIMKSNFLRFVCFKSGFGDCWYEVLLLVGCIDMVFNMGNFFEIRILLYCYFFFCFVCDVIGYCNCRSWGIDVFDLDIKISLLSFKFCE